MNFGNLKKIYRIQENPEKTLQWKMKIRFNSLSDSHELEWIEWAMMCENDSCNGVQLFPSVSRALQLFK